MLTVGSAQIFTNPVTAAGEPIHMGDPWAFRAEGAYFLVGTTAPHEGFQMYTSPDVAHWSKVGWVLRKQPGFWARDRITFGADGSMQVMPTRSPQPLPAGAP